MKVRVAVAGRLMLALLVLALGACAGSTVRPVLTPAKPRADALLVLPGFGYGRSGEAVFRTLVPKAAAEGIDLYAPKYMARGGIAEGRTNLQQFIREHRLDRYQRL